MDNSNKVYELGYLLVPSIAEEQLAGEVQNIKTVLEKYEPSYITEDFPKLRPLSYAMVKAAAGQNSKFDKAYFGWIKFEINPNAIPQVKTELDKNSGMLRFMIITTVRENTLISQKPVFKPVGEGEKVKKREDESPITQEELDKSIDSLVVE
jgi:ribosomal protein S6